MIDLTTITENPLKALRKLRNLTQRDVANLANMTPGAVLKYEQGLYEEPSCNLLDALCNDDAEMQEVTRLYHNWRAETRRQANSFLPPVGLFGHSFNAVDSPIKQFRELCGFTSAQAFCIALCIHPSVYASYEKGRVRSMPAMLKKALCEAGLSEGQILIIREFGEYYHDSLMGVQ